MVQFLSVLVVSACSILLISANRHTSPYPVYPLGISYLKTYLERTISGIRVDTADCNLLTDEEPGRTHPHARAPLHRGVAAQRGRRQFARPAGVSAGVQGADRRHTRSQRRTPDYRRGGILDLSAGVHAGAWGPITAFTARAKGRWRSLIGALERGETGADIPAVYTRDGRTGNGPMGNGPAENRLSENERTENTPTGNERTENGRRSYLPAIEVEFEPEPDRVLLEAERHAQHPDQAGVPLRVHLLFVSSYRRAVRAHDGPRNHRRKHPPRQARLRHKLPVLHRLGVQHPTRIQRPAGRNAHPARDERRVGRLLLAAGHRRRADAAVQSLRA